MFRRWRLAETIRVLGKRVAADIVEIGQRLIAVRETCGHGCHSPWLDKEFGWKESTAYNYIAVAERFTGKLPTVGTLLIDASALYLLAATTSAKSPPWRTPWRLASKLEQVVLRGAFERRPARTTTEPC